MSLKLYDWTNSYNSRKIVAVAFETDQKVTCVPVNMQAGEHKTPEFLAMNPNGKVPVMTDGNYTLWESNAIACYIASKDPSHRLLPTNPEQRAQVDQWLFWQTAHLSSVMGKIGYEKYWKAKYNLGTCDDKVVEEATTELNRFMGVLDTWLAKKEWVAGNLSVADFAIATAFSMRDAIQVNISEWKNVTSWLNRVEARPSWQQALKAWQ